MSGDHETPVTIKLEIAILYRRNLPKRLYKRIYENISVSESVIYIYRIIETKAINLIH
jgi:hypothetical protein